METISIRDGTGWGNTDFFFTFHVGFKKAESGIDINFGFANSEIGIDNLTLTLSLAFRDRR